MRQKIPIGSGGPLSQQPAEDAILQRHDGDYYSIVRSGVPAETREALAGPVEQACSSAGVETIEGGYLLGVRKVWREQGLVGAARFELIRPTGETTANTVVWRRGCLNLDEVQYDAPFALPYWLPYLETSPVLTPEGAELAAAVAWALHDHLERLRISDPQPDIHPSLER